jgi:hypothetical protein
MFLKAGQRPTTDGFDAIVVGSGPAGLTVALRLAGAGKRVLVIESDHGGGDIPPSIGYGHFSGTYWSAHSIRALGGTSNAWAGWVSPLRAIDFDHPVAGVRWPITLEELVPFYRLAAPYLDRHPSTADFHGQPVVPGWTYHPFSMHDPTRFGEKYRGTLAASKVIQVAVGHSVVSLDANPGRSSLTSLHCFDHAGGTAFDLPVRPEQAVALAGGGIGNAQLLLQPRADGARPVGNESGLAGMFLMEHPHVYEAGECVMARDLTRFAPPQRFGRSVHAIVADQATETAHGLFGCSLNFYHQNQDHELVKLYARPAVPFHHYQVDIRSEMLPSAANRVYMTAERTRAGICRPAVRCVFSAADILNADLAFRAFGESLLGLALGRVRVNNDAIYRTVTGGGHIMGTTRMGQSRSDSVVDRDCKVHGYDNFYIAGSSVFPTGGFANPTFTIVALAVRLADEVAKRG